MLFILSIPGHSMPEQPQITTQEKLQIYGDPQAEKPVNYIPEGWIQLGQDQKVKSTLDIEVGGCRITVDESTDPELLKKVCRVLRVL
jgi:hypothetical protein